MKRASLLLLKITTILCMNRKEAELVRVLSEKYKIDYQILIVSEGQRINNFELNQSKFTQIVRAKNIERTVIARSEIVRVGYFLFLENDEETSKILSKFEPIMFRRYIWFIRTFDKQNTFNIELDFDMDINLLHETGRGIDIYELYGLQGQAVLTQFGTFSNRFFNFESINKLERRTNLMGLTLR